MKKKRGAEKREEKGRSRRRGGQGEVKEESCLIPPALVGFGNCRCNLTYPTLATDGNTYPGT